MSSKQLTEDYVRAYYNRGLEHEDDYSEYRWFRSKESRFDYNQTRAALLAAIGGKQFTSVLEVGPGDGIWTEFVIKNATAYTLLDQSAEMLRLSKKRLAEHTHTTYVEANFATQTLPTAAYDLVLSVRCFEYIIDKQAALKKMYDTLMPGGSLVIITKNKHYKSLKRKAKNRALLHQEQISKRDMVAALQAAGFEVEAVYPAVVRWKARYGLFRMLFGCMHTLARISRGFIRVPWLTDAATESYTYIARKKKS